MASLNSDYTFPHPNFSDDQGLLVIGGELSTERLLKAYRSGIFPWFDETQPILWWSPDPRMVLFPENLHISKSMKKLFRQGRFNVTYNKAFDRVIQTCAHIERPDQDGTWLTREMIKAYQKLHKLGHAHSVEVWREKELVGGVYGVYLKEKRVFCGESMFSKMSNASKYGLISLVKRLQQEHLRLFDCQVYSRHLESLGAEEIPRTDFLKFLGK